MPLDPGVEHLSEWTTGESLSARKLNSQVRAINRLARGVDEPRQIIRPGKPPGGGGIFTAVIRQAIGESPMVLIAKAKLKSSDDGQPVWTIESETTPAWCIPPLKASAYAALVWEGATITTDAVVVPVFIVDGEPLVMQHLPWDVSVPDPGAPIEFTDCTPITRLL